MVVRVCVSIRNLCLWCVFVCLDLKLCHCLCSRVCCVCVLMRGCVLVSVFGFVVGFACGWVSVLVCLCLCLCARDCACVRVCDCVCVLYWCLWLCARCVSATVFAC